MQAKVLPGKPTTVARLARALRRGELVAVPTETVYGLAGDALNPRACRAIFRAKGRPSNDPLIVHVFQRSQVDELAERNEAADRVMEAFWPGPLTLVLPKKPAVPDIVTSGQPSVALRLPSHPLFRKLLRACGRPLAAPSANPFGYISPTTAEHVRESLGKKIPYILDGGPCAIGLESTIVDLRDPSRPAILRPGAISRAQLEGVLGRRVSTAARQAPRAGHAAVAPGLLSKHYSPRTPLELRKRITRAELQSAPANEAFLLLRKPRFSLPAELSDRVSWLSDAGDLESAARALFDSLRRLDRQRWAKLHAELAPGKSGLALAINDRLTRAAAKR